MTEPRSRFVRSAVIVLLALGLLSGCSVLRSFDAAVGVREIEPKEYIALKRGDIFTTGQPSAATQETVTVAGLDQGVCAKLNTATPECLYSLDETAGISDERRLSALAELWTQRALSSKADSSDDSRLQAWLEAARHAYAYLFCTERDPRDRAFEDRQTQVRDYYNVAVQQVASHLFMQRKRRSHHSQAVQKTVIAGWTIQPDLSAIRLPTDLGPLSELIPASSLSFSGLRSQYRRDGFGAELVAAMSEPPPENAPLKTSEPGPRHRYYLTQSTAWSEMPYPVITALLLFQGDTLEEVLATRTVTLAAYDPYEYDAVSIQGQRVPLAAHFTAGYGLWLVRSDFSTQSLRTLLGREHGIERPHLYLMQPYDPNRRILLMIHGLASSPEAWVNVANEVMGDEELRQNFQVWQVYYPTNMPIAFSHYEIRRAIDSALTHFDPSAKQNASRGMVVIGHSMGGVISRLMVSSSTDQLLESLLEGADLPERRRQRIETRLKPPLVFEPMPQIERAIFIAAPHRGTEIAGGRLGRWLAGMVRLPVRLLEHLGDILQDAHAGTHAGRTAPHIPNSVDNLRQDDPFIRAAADLPISPKVRYHSIIARVSENGELITTDDGLVPYRSAHLAGADSEKIITSGHSVQETAAAILELRRILHEDIKDYSTGDAAEALK